MVRIKQRNRYYHRIQEYVKGRQGNISGDRNWKRGEMNIIRRDRNMIRQADRNRIRKTMLE